MSPEIQAQPRSVPTGYVLVRNCVFFSNKFVVIVIFSSKGVSVNANVCRSVPRAALQHVDGGRLRGRAVLAPVPGRAGRPALRLPRRGRAAAQGHRARAGLRRRSVSPARFKILIFRTGIHI